MKMIEREEQGKKNRNQELQQGLNWKHLKLLLQLRKWRDKLMKMHQWCRRMRLQLGSPNYRLRGQNSEQLE
jgi:hypothetical protein